jgi:hypothetical protein
VAQNKNYMKKILLSAVAAISMTTASMAQTVPNYVPTNGLVSWWPFNGNANDESVNTNDGTVNGATLTTDRFGIANSAYSFDGVNDYIQCLQAGPSGDPTVTATFWLKTNQTSYGHIIGYGSNAISGNDFRVYINGNCTSGILFDTYQNAKGFSTTFNNNWDFYTLIYDGSIGNNTSISKIYKNGILISSVCFSVNATNTNIQTTNPIRFGRYHGNAQTGFYSGLLDDIGIWNRALTQQEITDLYNANICYDHVTVTDTLIINANLVGFNPVTYQNTIKVWPNPAHDHITIDNGNISNLNGYQIKITNVLGQQVFQSAINQQQFYIDLSTWTGNGAYYLNLINPQGVTIETKVIVVQ